MSDRAGFPIPVLHPCPKNGFLKKQMPKISVVTGPSRSGKSEWAEQLAMRSPNFVTYVATAQVDLTDVEWQTRILQHQQRRPADWRSLHVPVNLSSVVRAAADSEVLLIDSLGTWLANLLDLSDDDWRSQQDDFYNSLQTTLAEVILVVEEVGWGVVPPYPMGRTFRDRLGSLTRQISAIADATYLVTAGYVLDLHRLGFHLDRFQDTSNS